MPRKTKEQEILENNEKKEKTTKTATKKSSKTAATTKKTTKKTTAKKEPTKSVAKTKKTTTKKETKTKPKAKSTTTKSSSKTKKEDVAKTEAKKTSTKKASTTKSKKETTKKQTTAKKKSASKTAKKTTKTTAKKTTSKTKTTKRKTTSKKKKVEILEYYDLPYRYNQTVVKVLAQTPTTLFVYWDISDADRKNFEVQFGEKFFEQTKPVLIIYNDTLGYSFEVEINDFANSWYLHVADSKCDYRIELGRRPIKNEKNNNIDEKINTEYIHVTTSNEIESPNDKILFNPSQKMIYFRDVKTGVTTGKPVKTLSFIRNMGKIYDIYDLYKQIYQNENIDEIYNLSNPSSGNPSSGNPSSRFK